MRFYLRYAWFQFKEPFSDLGSGLFGLLTFPFYVWIIGKLWTRYNSVQSHLSLPQVLSYAAVTELFFLTFLRVNFFSKASRDFSLSLATPRSWLLQHFFGFFGRCLGSRLLLLGVLLLTLPLIGVSTEGLPSLALRVSLLLPILSIVQALYGLCFGIAQIRFEQTTYFVLPFTKFFLVLGGVFGPLCDYDDRWKKPLLLLWPSDLFFQPAYFSVTGSFYGLSVTEWLGRLAFQMLLLTLFVIATFRISKKYHQSWGG